MCSIARCSNDRQTSEKASVHRRTNRMLCIWYLMHQQRFLYLFTFNWNNTCNRSISRLNVCSLLAACNANRIMPKIELCHLPLPAMKRELFDLVHAQRIAKSLRSICICRENKHCKRHDIESEALMLSGPAKCVPAHGDAQQIGWNLKIVMDDTPMQKHLSFAVRMQIFIQMLQLILVEYTEREVEQQLLQHLLNMLFCSLGIITHAEE